MPNPDSPAISRLVNAPRSLWLLTLACAMTLALAPGRAAVLVHEYALRGSLNDSVGNTPLTSLGGQITALGYVFAANQGLTFSTPTLNPVNYSLEFSFKLDTVAGDRKLVDFQSLTSDLGVYDRNGALSFFASAAGGGPAIAPQTDVHLVLTRNSSTNLVSGYINGQLSFSFTDSGSAATANGSLGSFRFFVDDLVTLQTEASGGRVNFMRFYNGALTGGEVSSLYAAGPPLAVPEPSTFALLSAGGLVMAAAAWRRRRRR